MKFYISIMIFLFGILNIQSQTVAKHFKTNDFDVAIFPAILNDPINFEGFDITEEEVIKAEKKLKSNLKLINVNLENQHNKPLIHKKLKKYKRQYIGLYDEKGKKYLLINAFWSTHKEENWLNEIINVSDGGSYYWNIRYYIDTDELKELNVNGNS